MSHGSCRKHLALCCAEECNDDMDEVSETLEQELKTLAKIVCVPGESTCVAAWMRHTCAIILEVDEKAKIRTTTGSVIKYLKDFPMGHQKFSDTFKPKQSNDTKFLKMAFCLTTSLLSLNNIKSRCKKLMDHLQLNQMHLDKLFSGSDEEELIGCFTGFQADKTCLVGFSDDLRELINRVLLQPGKENMMDEAKKALTWPSRCPPFCHRVHNIARIHDGAQCVSKAIGITTAEEHAAFCKMILCRAQDKKKINRLGQHIDSPTHL